MDQRVHVLIGDDEVRARRSLRVLLNTWPEIKVVGEAADGQEIVRLVEERRPNVVLIDIRMPIMDGLETTRILKSRYPGIRVIILTMYADRRADALAAGADVFLLKGYPEELLTALRGTDKPAE
jgi:DNA-binding NarL/FixJ family response regulator